jgi:hypothetical protein
MRKVKGVELTAKEYEQYLQCIDKIKQSISKVEMDTYYQRAKRIINLAKARNEQVAVSQIG